MVIDEKGIARLEYLCFDAYNECDVLTGVIDRYRDRTGHTRRACWLIGFIVTGQIVLYAMDKRQFYSLPTDLLRYDTNAPKAI